MFLQYITLGHMSLASLYNTLMGKVVRWPIACIECCCWFYCRTVCDKSDWFCITILILCSDTVPTSQFITVSIPLMKMLNFHLLLSHIIDSSMFFDALFLSSIIYSLYFFLDFFSKVLFQPLIEVFLRGLQFLAKAITWPE